MTSLIIGPKILSVGKKIDYSLLSCVYRNNKNTPYVIFLAEVPVDMIGVLRRRR